MMTRAEKEMRIQFCRDLCDDLMLPGDYPPTYPEWVKQLALHMTRLGWTKLSAEATIEPPHGFQKTERPKETAA